MKTISAQQAAQQFDEYSQLAHDGEKILVTREGKPWVLLIPPAVPSEVALTAGKSEWPDFAGRLAKHYSAPVAGPTATDLLAPGQRRSLLRDVAGFRKGVGWNVMRDA